MCIFFVVQRHPHPRKIWSVPLWYNGIAYVLHFLIFQILQYCKIFKKYDKYRNRMKILQIIAYILRVCEGFAPRCEGFAPRCEEELGGNILKTCTLKYNKLKQENAKYCKNFVNHCKIFKH